MARSNDPDDVTVVRKVADRKGVTVGKPNKIVTSAMRSKVAFPAAGSTMMGGGGNFYSPELSTDFLELPQSDDEKRNFYRFFYDHDPFVGQAIDLLDELPLSKVRLRKPSAKSEKMAAASLRFCENWADRIKLLHRLMEISHEWNLLGEAHIFAEDTSPEMPEDIEFNVIREITPEGEIIERKEKREDAQERSIKWLKQNYRGWTAIRCLPPEQIHMESFPFTDEKLVELIPDSKTKAVINRANSGDPHAQRVVNSMPQDVVAAIQDGRNIPLSTDSSGGSFYHYLARKKSQYEPRGKSILGRCLLPGTPMWISRGGTLQQVPVEDVQPSDLALTHRGRLKPVTVGSRPVDEDITVLSIQGVVAPLRITDDHEILRLDPNGDESWVEAQNIQPGDMLVEGHVESSSGLSSIDLAGWWQGRELVVAKYGRRNRGEGARHLMAHNIKTDGSGLSVTFQYPNDNRNRARSVPRMQRLLDWVNSLMEPVLMTQQAVAVASGLSQRDVRVYSPRLRSEGLLRTETVGLGRGKGKITRWFPRGGSLPPVEVTFESAVARFTLSGDCCYLIGTWLGDGCLWGNQEHLLDVHGIGWSLHDPDVITRVQGLVHQVFPGVTIGRSPKNPEGGDLVIEDVLLARWFQENFGKTASGKHLPEWVFGLSTLQIKALLRGVLDTDGYLKKDGTYISVELANRTLVDQLHLLCNRVGWQTQVREVIRKPTSWTRTWDTQSGPKTRTYKYGTRSFWNLSCGRRDSILDWSEDTLKGATIGISQHTYTGNPKCSRFIGGRLTRKVRSVTSEYYQGVVHSFSVDGDESHVTGGVISHNCLRTLIFRDKVRQSLTSIASRHMTPYRLIYAEDMNAEQTEELREQVDLALRDPDFSIITNFQVTWEEMGADQRLPDWSWVYDFTDRQMYAGMGVTESLLSGESSYSGDRLNLEVINTRFMLMREVLQDLVEEEFFRPMCARMGFIEEDEDGIPRVIVPKLSFTRLSFRDNTETYDALFNLYQKGSLDVDTILEHLNLDPTTVREKLLADVGTIQDATFNEVLRGMYSRVGDALAENSDFAMKTAEYLDLKYEKPKEEGGGRFASVATRPAQIPEGFAEDVASLLFAKFKAEGSRP